MSTKTNACRLAQQAKQMKTQKEVTQMKTQQVQPVVEQTVDTTVTSIEVTETITAVASTESQPEVVNSSETNDETVVESEDSTTEINHLQEWLNTLDVNIGGITNLDLKDLNGNAVITALNLPTFVPMEVVDQLLVQLENVPVVQPYLPMVKGLLPGATVETEGIQVELILNMLLPIVKQKIESYLENAVKYLDLIKSKLNKWLGVEEITTSSTPDAGKSVTSAKEGVTIAPECAAIGLVELKGPLTPVAIELIMKTKHADLSGYAFMLKRNEYYSKLIAEMESA